MGRKKPHIDAPTALAELLSLLKSRSSKERREFMRRLNHLLLLFEEVENEGVIDLYYSPEERRRISELISAFYDEIDMDDTYEIFYSQKADYYFFCPLADIPKDRMEATIIKTADDLFAILISKMAAGTNGEELRQKALMCLNVVPTDDRLHYIELLEDILN